MEIGVKSKVKNFLDLLQNEESDEFRIFSFGAVNRNVNKKSGSKIKQAMIQ